jgi:hypothetical protein
MHAVWPQLHQELWPDPSYCRLDIRIAEVLLSLPGSDDRRRLSNCVGNHNCQFHLPRASHFLYRATLLNTCAVFTASGLLACTFASLLVAKAKHSSTFVNFAQLVAYFFARFGYSMGRLLPDLVVIVAGFKETKDAYPFPVYQPSR